MGEKSQTLKVMELEEAMERLQHYATLCLANSTLLEQKVEMWRAAAELSDTHCKELQLDFDNYRKEIELELVAARAYDLMREQLDQSNLHVERYRTALGRISTNCGCAGDCYLTANNALEAK